MHMYNYTNIQIYKRRHKHIYTYTNIHTFNLPDVQPQVHIYTPNIHTYIYIYKHQLYKYTRTHIHKSKCTYMQLYKHTKQTMNIYEYTNIQK